MESSAYPPSQQYRERQMYPQTPVVDKALEYQDPGVYSAWPKLKSFLESIKNGHFLVPTKDETGTSQTKIENDFKEAWSNVRVSVYPPTERWRGSRAGQVYEGSYAPRKNWHYPGGPARGTFPNGIHSSQLHGVGPAQPFYPSPQYENVRPNPMVRNPFYSGQQAYIHTSPSPNDGYSYGYAPPTNRLEGVPNTFNPFTGYNNLPNNAQYSGYDQGGYGRHDSKIYYGGSPNFSQGAPPMSPEQVPYNGNYQGSGYGKRESSQQPFDPTGMSTYQGTPPASKQWQ